MEYIIDSQARRFDLRTLAGRQRLVEAVDAAAAPRDQSHRA